MGDIVNLRRARKAKARATAADEAAANRVRFGLSHAERQAQEQVRLQDARKLDGHFREHEAGVPRIDDGTT